jgi:hypothetical protein
MGSVALGGEARAARGPRWIRKKCCPDKTCPVDSTHPLLRRTPCRLRVRVSRRLSPPHPPLLTRAMSTRAMSTGAIPTGAVRTQPVPRKALPPRVAAGAGGPNAAWSVPGVPSMGGRCWLVARLARCSTATARSRAAPVRPPPSGPTPRTSGGHPPRMQPEARGLGNGWPTRELTTPVAPRGNCPPRSPSSHSRRRSHRQRGPWDGPCPVSRPDRPTRRWQWTRGGARAVSRTISDGQ